MIQNYGDDQHRSRASIQFNRPSLGTTELRYISQALASGHRHGDGSFTARCHEWLVARTNCRVALLTTSCTTALEMAAILAGVGPGDEVVMPSYTFVSTANAFVLRGATPVLVDVDPATQNIDPEQVERAITPRTKAIVPVHYAGVACDMDALCAIARRHGLLLIEDAAQALLSTYRGRPLGSFGQLGTISFHDTKNTSSGEGGALLVNDPALVERAYVIRDKGTNRHQMLRGEVDKYTWCDVGSSFLPSEVTAAFLLAQLEASDATAESRRHTWQTYHRAFAAAEAQGLVRRPFIPPGCEHNGHIYYLILPSTAARGVFLARMKERGISAPFHYVPLHDSPAGRRFGRVGGSLAATEIAGSRLIRLPLWRDMPAEVVSTVIAEVWNVLTELKIASLAEEDASGVSRADGRDAPRPAAADTACAHSPSTPAPAP
ncbi:MAG: dTDP-4-amino-4,6-dideoxygalactose transaminase [Rhodospirillales bacterium]|jgi:dTDP-4-amino-4,6-dideoxygalactose transaminase|nr:dTDP-4-amino-4,6-dideoxygalactose transaminase [Rhodospirillales bacterium]